MPKTFSKGQSSIFQESCKPLLNESKRFLVRYESGFLATTNKQTNRCSFHECHNYSIHLPFRRKSDYFQTSDIVCFTQVDNNGSGTVTDWFQSGPQNPGIPVAPTAAWLPSHQNIQIKANCGLHQEEETRTRKKNSSLIHSRITNARWLLWKISCVNNTVYLKEKREGKSQNRIRTLLQSSPPYYIPQSSRMISSLLINEAAGDYLPRWWRDECWKAQGKKTHVIEFSRNRRQTQMRTTNKRQEAKEKKRTEYIFPHRQTRMKVPIRLKSN